MNKLLRAFTVLMLFTVAALTAATPANAAARTVFPSVYGCPNDSSHKGAICLYNHINYSSAGGVWKRAIDDLGDYNDGGVLGCTNLTRWNYDGTTIPVEDRASSLIINSSVPAPAGYTLWLFDGLNCSGRHMYCDMPNQLPYVYGVANLSGPIPQSNTSAPCRTPYENANFYDMVASVRLSG